MALYTHIYALYILHICTCTCILDVSKRGVLGSADDDIACFLHILSSFIDHGYMEDTGRSKIRQEFLSFRGSGLNK